MTLVLSSRIRPPNLNEATCCPGDVCPGDQPWRSGLQTLAWRLLEATGGGRSAVYHPQPGSCHGKALGLSSGTDQAGSELCFLGMQPALVPSGFRALRRVGRAGTGRLGFLKPRLSGHTLFLVPETHSRGPQTLTSLHWAGRGMWRLRATPTCAQKHSKAWSLVADSKSVPSPLPG